MSETKAEAEKLAEKMQDAWNDWAQASIGQGLLPYAEAILLAQEALAACMAYMPCSEVHNWPPGWKLRDAALKQAPAALAALRAITGKE